MEIDPLENKKQMDLQANRKPLGGQNCTQSGMMNTMRDLMKDISGSIPGIDEAMSFAELMKSVDSMDHAPWRRRWKTVGTQECSEVLEHGHVDDASTGMNANASNANRRNWKRRWKS